MFLRNFMMKDKEKAFLLNSITDYQADTKKKRKRSNIICKECDKAF